MSAGVVHGDLSEYNVILQPNMHVLIIDWPQWVRKDHPNALDLLGRDLKNVLDFFARKYRVRISFEEAVDFVVGKSEELSF
jgi:RIO kinase 2